MPGKLIIVESDERRAACAACFGDAAEIITAVPILTPVYRRPGKGKQGGFAFTPTPEGEALRAALECDREREIILVFEDGPGGRHAAWLISAWLRELGGRREPVLVTPFAFTPALIEAASREIRPIDEAPGREGYIRAAFDATLGRHLQRLIGTARGPGNMALDTALLAAVFLLQDREEGIGAFSPTPRWRVDATLRFEGHLFDARLQASFDLMTNGSVRTRREAEHIITLLEGDSFTVERVRRSPLTLPPPAPFRLPELLVEARRRLDLEPATVLEVLGRLTLTAVSTPFAGSGDIGGLVRAALAAEVEKRYGAEALGPEGEGLEAGMICPADPALAAKTAADLGEEARRLYELIESRALAACMTPATGELIQMEIAAGPESVFTVAFRSISDPGFLREDLGDNDPELLTPSPFAVVEEGTVFEAVRLRAAEEGGLPPERYTFETLLTDLADFAVRPVPGTIAMLQGLLDHGYLECAADGFLRPGPRAREVHAVLDKAFPRMRGIAFAAYIEQTVAEVVSGRKEFAFALKQFDQTLMLQGKSLVKVKIPTTIPRRKRRSSTVIIRQPQSAEKTPATETEEALAPLPAEDEALAAEGTVAAPPAEPVAAADQEEAGEAPPAAETTVEAVSAEEETGIPGGEDEAGTEEPAADEIVVSQPEAAPADESWPEEMKSAFEQALRGEADEDGRAGDQEDHAPEPAPETSARVVATDEDRTCLACGRPMVLKEDNYGRFWECSGFPECRHSESWSAETRPPCPVCANGEIVVKRTPVGKEFFVCSRPECEFIAWSKPHAETCALCGSPFLVEKKTPRGLILRCPRAGCDYSTGADGHETVPASQGKKKIRVRRVKKGSKTGGKRVRIVRRKKK